MSTKVTWNGSHIEMWAQISGRYMYLAAETSLSVDGRVVGTTGGFNFTESASGSFTGRDGAEHAVELQVSAGLFTLTHASYVLRVDGIVVSQGSLALERLGLAFLGYGVILLVPLGLAGGAFYFLFAR
jgi:hypothetical protein